MGTPTRNAAGGLTRRETLRVSAAMVLTLAAGRGCGRTSPNPKEQGPSELVLYCSADADLAQPIVDAFIKQTGIAVRCVFDTEATKTTGLVNRLLAEVERPRADVWWSSEPFGTIRLAKQGALERYTSAAAERQMAAYGGWPPSLRGKDGRWYGFGSRARVIACNTAHVPKAPERFMFIGSPLDGWQGRIGMARPQFGTTRGHVAAFAAAYGEPTLRECLTSMKQAGLRLFDGNAAIARALGTGEIHIGLTDSDDVFAGQARGWPIGWGFESDLEASEPGPAGMVKFRGIGPLFLPNTVAMVRGTANPLNAGKLIDHILSPETQRAMAKSESRNIPVDPRLGEELADWAQGGPALHPADYEQIERAIDGAMKVCDEVLG